MLNLYKCMLYLVSTEFISYWKLLFEESLLLAKLIERLKQALPSCFCEPSGSSESPWSEYSN